MSSIGERFPERQMLGKLSLLIPLDFLSDSRLFSAVLSASYLPDTRDAERVFLAPSSPDCWPGSVNLASARRTSSRSAPSLLTACNSPGKSLHSPRGSLKAFASACNDRSDTDDRSGDGERVYRELATRDTASEARFSTEFRPEIGGGTRPGCVGNWTYLGGEVEVQSEQ